MALIDALTVSSLAGLMVAGTFFVGIDVGRMIGLKQCGKLDDYLEDN